MIYATENQEHKKTGYKKKADAKRFHYFILAFQKYMNDISELPFFIIEIFFTVKFF